MSWPRRVEGEKDEGHPPTNRLGDGERCFKRPLRHTPRLAHHTQSTARDINLRARQRRLEWIG